MLKNGYQSANTSPAIISFSIGLSHEAKGSDWSVLLIALTAPSSDISSFTNVRPEVASVLKCRLDPSRNMQSRWSRRCVWVRGSMQTFERILEGCSEFGIILVEEHDERSAVLTRLLDCVQPRMTLRRNGFGHVGAQRHRLGALAYSQSQQGKCLSCAGISRCAMISGMRGQCRSDLKPCLLGGRKIRKDCV